MTGRDYCRVDDDPSYDYSDYDEGKGYYKPYDNNDDYHAPTHEILHLKRQPVCKTHQMQAGNCNEHLIH